MLVDHPRLKDKLVKAHLETCYRMKEEDGRVDFNGERFQFVVDESDEPLATVTDKYTLVQHREVISALDLAADARGLSLEPTEAHYINGRLVTKFEVPGYEMQVGTDPSQTKLTINVHNDYKGEGGLAVLIGWFRMICSNGLVIGEVAASNKRRHVGNINVGEFMSTAVNKAVGRFEAERLIAQTLAEHRYPLAAWNPASRDVAAKRVRKAKTDGTTPDIVDLILADTAERYHDDLNRAVRENVREIGENLWALSQAVAEIATHRMQQRADGSTLTRGFNSAADTWATRQSNRIRRLVDVR